LGTALLWLAAARTAQTTVQDDALAVCVAFGVWPCAYANHRLPRIRERRGRRSFRRLWRGLASRRVGPRPRCRRSSQVKLTRYPGIAVGPRGAAIVATGALPRTSLPTPNKSARFPVKCAPLADSRSRPKRRGRATYANFSKDGVRECWRPFRVGIACAIFLSRASAPSSARVSPSEGVISWLL
jgi:hypothetical protein